jgi:histidine triad (HIT) family protein
MPSSELCVFCQIVRDEAQATIVRSSHETTAFVPLNPVTEGHILVVPNTHVADALENPLVTASVVRRVAELATAPCNIITSVGMLATQSIRHLHVHIIPRRPHDRLKLPWGNNFHQSQEYLENAYAFYNG